MNRSKNGREPQHFYEADVLFNGNDNSVIDPHLPIPRDLDDRAAHLRTIDSRTVSEDDKFDSRLNRLTVLDIEDERRLKNDLFSDY